MKVLLLVIVVVFIGCDPTTSTHVSSDDPTSQARPPKVIAPPSEELIYLEELPLTEVSPQPIVVVMHGYNSNEIDPVRWIQEINDRFFVVSVRAPIETRPGRFAWYKFGPEQQSEVERHADMVIRVIKSLPRNIDSQGNETKRAPVIVAGFSQGGRMALEVAKRAEPGLVQGILALSPDTFEPGKVTAPTLVTHGREDNVVAFGDVEPSVKELSGAAIDFITFDGKHTIPKSVRLKAHTWSDKIIDAVKK